MKAAIFAVLFLCILDFAVNHGAGTHAFMRGLSAFGAGIGAWVYYA